MTRWRLRLETEFVALQRQYQGLAQEFDDLKAQYQHLRRPFTVSKDVPFTDVWHYPAVPYYPGKHPCEKPAAMLKHIINASSRPRDVVLDCFMACKALGRHFIGIELDEEIFNQVRAGME
ncbi:site-specific DNA-methyltransferase [Shewanella algae]|uniref:site-specific DNA-methyltransferase n=1 Tax=Shewanella algae TaxID=38313 RepID=UPI0031F49C99